MNLRKIVPQPVFDTVTEFIEGSNNYYVMWIEDVDHGKERRNYASYKRFHERYPHFSNMLLEKTTWMWNNLYHEPWEKRLPWVDLYISYNLMSELVFDFDKDQRLTN